MQEHRPSHDSPRTPGAGAARLSAQAAPSGRGAKNLYEPYVTPAWFWVSLRALARLVFFLILNVELSGRQNLPEQGPYFLVSNHLSWTDVPLVPAYLSPQVVYLAKEELFMSRIGWLVRFLGAIPVKRGEADRQLLRACDDLLKRGRILVIFPEGHRSDNHQLIQAHAGMGLIALRAGVPVVPVAIRGSEYTLKRFRPRVTISYGEPLTLKPRGAKITKEDIQEATDTVMRRIAAMLPPAYRGVYEDDNV
ncbi:MAG TPA: lysophospholipid acyltransferase family protein [Ktedonobacteraceae bacterium]|jgi:1-acyl-sn-glycerol-3-phosphate acyltransferase